MNVLIVGGGGREHALAWLCARHGHSIFATQPNPGILGLGARLLPGGDLVAAAREARVDLVVVGPEQPLAEGLVDRLVTAGVPAFGPTAAAARLETSKVFTKRFCLRHGLPTAAATIVEPGAPLPSPGGAAVVKLDGLAAGKGVWVCPDAASAAQALAEARAARPAEPILLEETLSGREVSVLALADGAHIAPVPAARDHKRRFDGDRGPNTGGMGAIAPIRFPEYDVCVEILQQAVAAAARDDMPFRGVLYGGFMLTPDGPKLLEFNVRFGDPECQVLMALWDEDPTPWLLGAATGRLPGRALRQRPLSACCVVVTGDGYPDRGADAPVDALPGEQPDLVVFHAGTVKQAGVTWARGGRVFGVTGLGPSPEAARARAYQGVEKVRFRGAAWRSDIGAAPWT